MDRNGQVRVYHSNKLDALLCVHGHHQHWKFRRWDRGAAQVDQHEIDVLTLVAFWDLLELVDQQSVARDVDSKSSQSAIIETICLNT